MPSHAVRLCGSCVTCEEMRDSLGVPLDASFAEQKKILKRCPGLFYLCAGGAEARRFNRLLIDAGLIQGF